ncbi:unnamed protein product [Allacma fusca]|uniref:Nitrilase and fragile histidine triad fusion protein NitFhit n=1 Tax=Allacma fusca TaxID=39272 RepID=A0A8J2LTZ7_9HEXA|nr:unnamed protein product [Allacma fusca]
MAAESKCIAAIQITSGNDKDKNIQVCNELIGYAVSQKQAKMVFLPEGFDFIASGKDETIQLAENLDGPVIENYRNIAKKYQVWLSLGGFHRRFNSDPAETEKIANTHVIINDNGSIVATYDKAHLFDVHLPEQHLEMRESSTIKSGTEIVKPIQTPVGKIGLAICYDLRFPEFSEKLRSMDAELLTYPSAFTKHTGAAHWEVLLRARAIENQCYVVAAAQIGQHNPKRCSYGHSMIIDPWGVIIAQACATETIIFAEINLQELHKIRSEMPVINHKRYDLYDHPPKQIKYSIPDTSIGEDLYDFGQVKIKAKFVFLESNLSRAFVNKKCILPGHVLVISKRKVPRVNDLTDEEYSDLHILVKKVAEIMESIHGSTSANLACQDGPHSGQSISHVHIHVLPRKEGDFARTDEVHEKLENFGKDNEEPKWRQENDMVEECDNIRATIRSTFAPLLE